MHLDVQELRNFYYRQALGRAVQRTLLGEALPLLVTRRSSIVGGIHSMPHILHLLG